MDQNSVLNTWLEGTYFWVAKTYVKYLYCNTWVANFLFLVANYQMLRTTVLINWPLILDWNWMDRPWLARCKSCALIRFDRRKLAVLTFHSEIRKKEGRTSNGFFTVCLRFRPQRQDDYFQFISEASGIFLRQYQKLSRA